MWTHWFTGGYCSSNEFQLCDVSKMIITVSLMILNACVYAN